MQETLRSFSSIHIHFSATLMSMHYVLLGLGVLIGVVAIYRFFLNAEARQIGAFLFALVTGIMAIALLFLALTGRLPAAIALVSALWPLGLAWWKKKKGSKNEGKEGSGAGMSLEEALEILGLNANPLPTEEEIDHAYKELMKKVHPDQKGTEGLAKQLNIAKDRLLQHIKNTDNTQ